MRRSQLDEGSQRDGDNERSAEDNEDTESDASCIVGGHEMSVYGRDLGIH